MNEIQQAIKYFESCRLMRVGDGAHNLTALSALREQAARLNPHPLTLEELRERVGKPAWIEVKNEAEYCEPSYWAIVGNEWDNGEGIALDDAYTGDGAAYYLYGKTWLAYDHEPQEEV